MHSVEADSIWLWSFIWTWQEAAAAAEAHQREALWGEDQIKASDAKMDPAKTRPWIHEHTHTHTHAWTDKPTHSKGIQSNSTFSVRPLSLDVYAHSCAEAYVHEAAHKHTTRTLKFTFYARRSMTQAHTQRRNKSEFKEKFFTES